MPIPEDLYTLHGDPPRLDGPVLLYSFTGFLDAGSASEGAVEHLLDTLDHRVVATFDQDELVDYRSRRPRMTFAEDRYAEVEDDPLVLREVTDATGTRFLLLAGPEPDLRWNQFVAAVIGLVERLGVRLAASMSGVPFPVPHTRPVRLTAHATDPALITGHSPWVGTVQIPGHVAGLLELRLGQAGHPALGFAAHVPHYLAQVPYPRASVALLDAVSGATGLMLATEALRAAAETTDAEIAAQVARNEENLPIVHALERQYDAFAGSAGRSGVGGLGPLPSGEEIAAQVQDFLAEIEGRSGGDDGS